MHELFSDWLKDSGLDGKDQPLVEWWQGLEEYCSNITRSSLMALLRFAAMSNVSETNVPEGFRDVIKAKDSGFPMRDNLFQVQQLARVAVRILFDKTELTDHRAHTAALGLICGSFGKDNGSVYREHVQKASEFLARAADELRIRDKTNQLGGVKTPSISTSLEDATDTKQLGALLGPLIPNILSAMHGLARRLTLQEEEINMLWWIFGERSRDLKVAFRDLSPGAAAVVAAKELADLTAFPPGPLSFEGILCRALAVDSLDRKMKLQEVINSLDNKWRASLAEPLSQLGDVLFLCPLNLMIIKSLEGKLKKDWPVLFRAACDVSVDLKASPRETSSQFYYERIFVKSLEYVD